MGHLYEAGYASSEKGRPWRSVKSNADYDRLRRESDQPPLGPTGIETALQGFSRELHLSAELKAFAAARGMDTGPFYRMGARFRGPDLAFTQPAGVKFRRMTKVWDPTRREYVTRRWMRGQFKRHPMNIYYGNEPYRRVLVVESETDCAALLVLYRDYDVALMPLGAKNWFPIWSAQLDCYPKIYIALDNDPSGEYGAGLIKKALPRAARHAPPDGAKDWSAWYAARRQEDGR
jgi:hypothetical protein